MATETNTTAYNGYATDLRKARPVQALKADYGNSRKEAINLFCLECCGGSRKEVAECSANYCFLWPYRPYGATRTDLRAGAIVSEKELGELREEKVTDAQRAAGYRLAALTSD